MLTRQPVCENEIVPSLHSNLGGVSAAGGGVAAAAVCCGAGACATGFGDKAQPAHESRINKAKPIRIRVASGKPHSAADAVDVVARQPAAKRVQHTTAQPDSDIRANAFRAGRWTGAILKWKQTSRDAGAAAALALSVPRDGSAKISKRRSSPPGRE